MPRTTRAGSYRPLSFPGAGTRIAMISVHTSPAARPGGYAAGGMNVYIREVARRLGRRGFTVDLFTRDDGAQPNLASIAPGVRLIGLPAGPREPLTKEDTAALLPEFLHAVRHFRQVHDLHYDLIHSHYWHAGWVASLLAPRWGVPHVATFHTLGEVKNRALLGEHETEQRIAAEQRIVQSADRLICFGEHERQALRGLYGAQLDRIAVIPCGVDLRRFRPLDRDASRAALGFGPEPIVLYVGRVEPLKGIDLLIEAVAQLERKDVTLVIVGGDEHAAAELRRLRTRAARRGIGDRVRFLPAVDQSELPRFYNAADVCVVPSYHESFGMVAVEAMACGTPVIASHVGGLATTVADGETGYLIPWHCPEPFAERIELLIENDELRRNLSGTARQAMRRYSWDRITAELAAEYSRVWQERAGGDACHGSLAAESPHTACDAR